MAGCFPYTVIHFGCFLSLAGQEGFEKLFAFLAGKHLPFLAFFRQPVTYARQPAINFASTLQREKEKWKSLAALLAEVCFLLQKKNPFRVESATYFVCQMSTLPRLLFASQRDMFAKAFDAQNVPCLVWKGKRRKRRKLKRIRLKYAKVDIAISVPSCQY